MPALTRLAGNIHKWLALLIAVQLLFWFGSGLFFAIVPIERVRSEHRIADTVAGSIDLGAVAQGLEQVTQGLPQPPESLRIHRLLDRTVARLEFGATAPPLLIALDDGERLSPLSGELAMAVAQRDYAGTAAITRVTAVTEASTEYRGRLPAWRVDFDDGAGTSLYVAQHTAEVTARRSTLWRAYDLLWSLHIMDWSEHEDFNTPWLVLAAFLGLTLLLTGVVLFPVRLGWTAAWRRRRRRAG